MTFVLSGPSGFLCYYDTDNIEEEGKTILFSSESEIDDFVEELYKKSGRADLFGDAYIVEVNRDEITNWIEWAELRILPDGEVARKEN